jgi:hypothetical protein
MIDLLIRFEQHRPLCQRNNRQMRLQGFAIGARQGRQQFVGQRARCPRVQRDIPPGRSGPISAGENVAFRVDASTGYFCVLDRVASWCLFGSRHKDNGPNLCGRINIGRPTYYRNFPSKLMSGTEHMRYCLPSSTGPWQLSMTESSAGSRPNLVVKLCAQSASS